MYQRPSPNLQSTPIVQGGGVEIDVTIASGATLSSAADLGTARLEGLGLPATLTGTALSFRGSINGTDYYPIYLGSVTNSAFSLTVGTISASQRMISLTAEQKDVFKPWRYLKVVSGTTEVADRTITLVAR